MSLPAYNAAFFKGSMSLKVPVIHVLVCKQTGTYLFVRLLWGKVGVGAQTNVGHESVMVDRGMTHVHG